MHGEKAIWVVKEVLLDYVKYPTLKTLRSPSAIDAVAREIVKRLDRHYSMWGKWDEERSELLRIAMRCWIPVEDLTNFMNGMRGTKLTTTDVTQRLEAMLIECPYDDRNEEFKEGCLAIYEEEKALGTELTAIVWRIRDYVDEEEGRLFSERQEYWKRQNEEKRIAREQTLLSGVDCSWTKMRGSRVLFCRKSGKLFRLTPTEKKTLKLFRVETTGLDEKGTLLGEYQRQGQASKAVAQIASMPERWS